MKLYKRFEDDLDKFVGQEVWVLMGEYTHGNSFYGRIVKANAYAVYVNLVPALDVEEATHHFSDVALTTTYCLNREDVWINPNELLTTEELKDLAVRRDS